MSVRKQGFWAVLAIVSVLTLAAGLSPPVAGFLSAIGLSAPLRILGLAQGDTTATSQDGNDTARPGSGRSVIVALQPVGSAVINDKVTALGTGVALQSVMVLPKADGTLTEISVASGARVVQGQAIARLDSTAQEIARDRAKLSADDARRTLERNKVLVENSAAPANQTQAVELAAQLADLALRAAEQDLADRVIVAPIAGVVGILKVSLGNTVTPQTQIVSIEDSSQIVVNFWLPERLAGQVDVADPLTLVPVARPEQTIAAFVTSIDNQIEPASGTFQVQSQIDNPDATLRPGMAFTITMRFAGQTYPTVSPLSVQWGSDGAYVWRVSAGEAEKVPVRIVQRNTDSVLVAGALKPDEMVVTEGLGGLKDGAQVHVIDGFYGAAGAADSQKEDQSSTSAAAGN